MHGPAVSNGLASLIATVEQLGDRPATVSPVVGYALFFLGFVALAALGVYVVQARRRAYALTTRGGAPGEIDREALRANAELVASLMRTVAPAHVTEWFQRDPAQSPDEELERYRRLLRSPYDSDLRRLPRDGNGYLALARMHVTLTQIVAEIDSQRDCIARVQQQTITEDRVVNSAYKAVFTVIGLLLACAGAIFGGIAVF